MSEMEAYTGTLEEVKLDPGQTIEDKMKEIVDKNGLTIDESFHDDVEEYFRETFYNEYIILDGKIFKIKNLEDGDIYQAKKNPDNTINFTVRYYNGGCSFEEAIEKACKNLKE